MSGSKRAVLAVLIGGIAFWLWQTSRETPPGAPPPAPAPSTETATAPPPAAAENEKDKEKLPPAPSPQEAAARPTTTEPRPSALFPGTALPAAPPPAPTPTIPSDKAAEVGMPVERALQLDFAEFQFLLRDFRTSFGGNPVGSNSDIIKALLGRNPKNLALSLWKGHRLNAAGELIDPWGTPYFFHQISGQQMEVHCAGPDRIMWNKDDIAAQ